MRIRFHLEPMLFKQDDGEKDEASPPPVILPENDIIRYGKQNFRVDVKTFEKLPVCASGAFGTIRRFCLQEFPRIEIALKRVLRSAVKEVDILQTVATSERASIVEYYSTLTEPGSDHMWICLEYMDASLLVFSQVMHQLYEPTGVPCEELDLLLFRILSNCVEGLSHLENKGYVHRDIKPDNILINWSCLVKLCDFGISTSLVKLRSKNLPEKGTELYIPPRRAHDTRDDMWSLGLTLLAIANGNHPFLADKNGQACHRLGFIPPLSETMADLMKYCIWYLVQEDPNDRPASYAVISRWECIRTVPFAPLAKELQFVQKILITIDPAAAMPRSN